MRIRRRDGLIAGPRFNPDLYRMSTVNETSNFIFEFSAGHRLFYFLLPVNS